MAAKKNVQTVVVPQVVSRAEEGEYNGHPTLKVSKNDRFNSFMAGGVAKWNMVLDHLDEIKAFVNKHDKTKTVETPKNKPGRPRKTA